MSGDEVLRALHPGKGGLYLDVHAQPGARRERIVGMHGEAVKIATREPAQDGKANAAIERMIAAILEVPPADVKVASGQRSRKKRVFVAGNAEELTKRWLAWWSGQGPAG